VIPFLFMRSAGPALRVSNAIAIVMLFVLGFSFGRNTARNPWATCLFMVVLGGLLVALTKALGG
jgi:VIT1/CCC1 family predicted Fe2+/Mn2+ transporter